MMLFFSNCLSNLINIIWFIVIHLNFFSKIVVLFYCFEEQCISNILLDAPSCGFRTEAKSFFSLTKIMPLNII